MFESILLGSLLVASTSAPTAQTPDLLGFPEKKTLANEYYVSQTFNNCGPAALSMVLSYFDIHVSQEQLGSELRPYQNEVGDNDDKSVTLEELAEKGAEYDLVAFHRPNGNMNLLKYFIAHDIPVLTRSWMADDEDIGHYRVVKGFDDTLQITIQDDPIEDKNLTYSYDEFLYLWEKFNYEYLVLVPQEKVAIAEAIIGENLDQAAAWKRAAAHAEKKIQENPDDLYARFNASVALHNLSDYTDAIKEFEKIETQLPSHALWYQIEPIESYYEVGDYEKVFALTEHILNNNNRAFSELYLLRGKIYQKQGDLASARSEFEKAVYYNRSLKEAQDALKSLL